MSSNLMEKSDDNEGVIKVANRIITSDRPNPISAEPNRTIFLPNYSSPDRTMFGQNGRTCSVNGPNFCRRFGSAEPSVRFGSAFAERVRGSVDH